MDDAQNVVAFDDRRDDDAHGIDVIDLFKASAAHINLAVDAVKAFDTSLDMRFDVVFMQTRKDAFLHIFNKV